MRRFFPLPLLIAALFLATAAAAADLETLLAQPDPPAGVVFEVVQGQGDALVWALPKVREQVERLRQQFPGVPVALVTHGNEQFALLRSANESYPGIQDAVRDMVNDQGIDIHVCGTYADMHGKAPEDFIGIVDVAAAGPQQIEDYEALGYARIVIRGD